MDAIFILSGDFSAEKGKKGRGRDETKGVICIKVYNRKAFGGSGKLCGEQKELTVGRRGGKGALGRRDGRKGRAVGRRGRKGGRKNRNCKADEKIFSAGQKNSGRRVAVRGKLWYNRSMEKLRTDVHTHTTFSADGISPMEEMLKKAEEKELAFYGISEHFDYDYLVNGIPFYGGEEATYTDPDAYFPHARSLAAAYAGKLRVLVGGEFGYTDNRKAWTLYRELEEKYRPDFVVNSVHTNGKYDYSDSENRPYRNADGTLRPKSEAYREYFGFVRRSLDVPYGYDIVGHMTYCTRYAPYADRRARWEEFRAEIDSILCGIIARRKILEVNSSCRGAAGDFLPGRDILSRYYELGGRKLSFASDAHDVSRVADKRETVVKALRGLGFDRITVPCRGRHVEVEL